MRNIQHKEQRQRLPLSKDKNKNESPKQNTDPAAMAPKNSLAGPWGQRLGQDTSKGGGEVVMSKGSRGCGSPSGFRYLQTSQGGSLASES